MFSLLPYPNIVKIYFILLAVLHIVFLISLVAPLLFQSGSPGQSPPRQPSKGIPLHAGQIPSDSAQITSDCNSIFPNRQQAVLDRSTE